MNEKIKKIIQTPKMLVVFGVCGILLIFISSLFTKNDDEVVQSSGATYDMEEYCQSLEEDIKSIVTGITGDKKPTVVVTLESGIRYNYASADETDTSNSSGTSADQSSESKKQSYITIKTADGGEKALVVTEVMPQIRGVAIICDGGNSTAVAEKIKNAVTAALNINSKRVYISGGTR